MRRIAPLAAVVFLLAAPAAHAGAPAGVALVECDRDFQVAEFQARMQTVPGAQRMQMRFTLKVERGRRGYRRVAAPGFGVWTTADPGVTRYVYTRRVEDLLGPARYRVYVRFRWLDAEGRTIERASARSRYCRQPDPRPNLTVRALEIEPIGDPERRRYVVLVRNTGRGDAEPFELEVSGAEPVLVDGLQRGEERLVELVGPACEPGWKVTATADPLDEIEERSERDNALAITC
jgi:CARDB